MPQLDFSLFPSQIFWLTLSFGGLYFVVSYVLMPLVRDISLLRQNKIDKDIASANQAKVSIAKMRENYEAKLQELEDESQKMLNDSLGRYQEMADVKTQRLDDKISRIMHKAELEISDLNHNFKQELRDEACKYSAHLYQKVVGTKIDSKDFKKYLN